MMQMTRKVFDRRALPGECSLTIPGDQDEVVAAQAAHAVAVHGEKDTPELRQLIRSYLKDESPAHR
jgi:hypothetical protein